MNDLVQRTALGIGSSAPMQRLLRFYQRQGVLPATETVEDDSPATETVEDDPPATDVPAAPTDAALAQRVALLESLWEDVLPRVQPALSDLTEEPPDDDLPVLDRRVDPEGTLTPDQAHWRQQGFVIKQRFLPDDLLDAYWAVRSAVPEDHAWFCNVPYMHIPEARALALYPPLVALLDELIGEPMAVNLNLTGIVSTERNWHQDDYLNPPHVNGHYVAVWMAVGDIDPDSGPFQYVPGSHRWPLLRSDRVRMFLPDDQRDDPNWPRLTESFLDDLLEDEIARRQAAVQTFVPKRGDLLVWHSRLVHRGSFPRTPGMRRPSFIAHYTAASHWVGHLGIAEDPDGGLYCLSDEPLDNRV